MKTANVLRHESSPSMPVATAIVFVVDDDISVRESLQDWALHLRKKADAAYARHD